MISSKSSLIFFGLEWNLVVVLKNILVPVLLLVLFSLPSEARRNKKINVKGPFKKQLNLVLKDASSLHLACVSKNRVKISSSMRKLIKSLTRAIKTSQASRAHRTHLYKMLVSAKTKIELSQWQKGVKRQDSLKRAFHQIVEIDRVYKLDKYKVFFCAKDRSIWLQKSWKPRNPIHPVKFEKCGRLVR